MANSPDNFNDYKVSVPILAGASPASLRGNVRADLAAPFNLQLFKEETEKVVKPTTEMLISSAYLWREAHDTDPNPTWKDRIDWFRGVNEYRRWFTDTMFSSDDPTVSPYLEFRDYRKNTLFLDKYSADFTDTGFSSFKHRIELRYHLNNLRDIRFTGDKQTRREMIEFANTRGDANFSTYLNSFLPDIEKLDEESVPTYSYVSRWDLEVGSVSTDLVVETIDGKQGTSNRVLFDPSTGELLRKWRFDTGKSDLANATKWGLPVNNIINPETFFNDLSSVLSIIPSEILGDT